MWSGDTENFDASDNSSDSDDHKDARSVISPRRLRRTILGHKASFVRVSAGKDSALSHRLRSQSPFPKEKYQAPLH
jgi:hypothetical protein